MGGRGGEGGRVVSGAAETQKVAGLTLRPGPARVPRSSWVPSWLMLKKEAVEPKVIPKAVVSGSPCLEQGLVQGLVEKMHGI